MIVAAGTDASSMGDSIYTSSLSGMSGGTSFSSTSTVVPDRASSAIDNDNYSLTQRRVERMHSGRSRDRHHHSHSRHHHKEELKTVGEYALHVLFTSVSSLKCTLFNIHHNNSFQFIAQAEEKISQCITVPLDPEPQIEQICGPGVDPTFDQLISALGHIASQKPKPLIDSMMLWRKNKSDAASEARAQLQQVSAVVQHASTLLISVTVSRNYPTRPITPTEHGTTSHAIGRFLVFK